MAQLPKPIASTWTAQPAQWKSNNLLRDDWVIGYDPAFSNDKSMMVYTKRPGRVRRFLRCIKLDRSTWETKVVRMEEKDGTTT